MTPIQFFMLAAQTAMLAAGVPVKAAVHYFLTICSNYTGSIVYNLSMAEQEKLINELVDCAMKGTKPGWFNNVLEGRFAGQE